MMQTDPKKPNDADPDDADAAPLIPDIADDTDPAEAIKENGEPFDDNFA